MTNADGDLVHGPPEHPLGVLRKGRQAGQTGETPLDEATGVEHKRLISPSQIVRPEGRVRTALTRAPGVLAHTMRPLEEADELEDTGLEAVMVDNQPFASRAGVLAPKRGGHLYQPGKPAQGELPIAPQSPDGKKIHDVVIASLSEMPLTGDERSALRNDVYRLGLVACALTGTVRITPQQSARFVGGTATVANIRRWNAAVITARSMVVILDRTTLDARDLLVASMHSLGVDVRVPSWWLEGKDQAWRLSGAVFRKLPVAPDAKGKRGPKAGYWGGVARTLNGIESAITWSPTAGRGRGASPRCYSPRSPAKPGRKCSFRGTRCCATREPVDENTPYREQGAGQRFRRRVDAMLEMGYETPTNAAGHALADRSARTVDTVELRRQRASTSAQRL